MCFFPVGRLNSPNPHPVNLHLLRKHSAAIGTADEVSTDCNIEDDEKRTLKFRRAVHSVRDVCFAILNSIDVPLDRAPGPRDRKRVEARRKRT